ncbi:AAA family ATPase [Nonomuraea sp. bgisy101]|uniref:AAA family ATPase n=1 Tax=Nonomuraea sp. bgisy101 TaxID=3413784 RepID=UPI003D749780
MAALNERGLAVRDRRGYLMAQCPAHDDQTPSLSIRPVAGKVLLKCFPGCETRDVAAALDLPMSALFDEEKDKGRMAAPVTIAEYEYVDEHGGLLFVVERKFPKGFKQKHRDDRGKWVRNLQGVRRVLYRLPAVVEAAANAETVYVVEGEKDVAACERRGLVATCNPGGTGMGWHSSYGDFLKGAHVVIVADRDDKGREHAERVAADLDGKARSVRLVEPAIGKDISDHFAAGKSVDDLRPIGSEPESEGEEELPRRQLVLTAASSIRVRPVRWLWDTTPDGQPPTSHGRIPMNSLSIAAGGPGLGKSQFGVWMTARITNGALPGELFGKPRCVIYAATEDSWAYTIAPRLIAAGADLDKVFRVDVEDDGKPHARLTLPSDTSMLGQVAEEYSVSLLVADPLLSLIDKSINDYRAAEVRQALEPLVAAADKHHFTILGLAHFTKSGVADPLARVAGSGAFGQLIRSLVVFAREENEDGDDTYVLSCEKNNLGRLGLPSFEYMIQPFTVDTEDGPSYVSRFVLGPETATTVRQVMRDEVMPDLDREETSETVKWLRGYLADLGGTDFLDDLKKTARKRGISESALKRARRKLGIKSQQQGFGADKRALWILPGTIADES